MPESPSLAQEPPQCTLGAPAGLKGIYGVLGQQDPGVTAMKGTKVHGPLRSGPRGPLRPCERVNCKSLGG